MFCGSLLIVFLFKGKIVLPGEDDSGDSDTCGGGTAEDSDYSASYYAARKKMNSECSSRKCLLLNYFSISIKIFRFSCEKVLGQGQVTIAETVTI